MKTAPRLAEVVDIALLATDIDTLEADLDIVAETRRMLERVSARMNCVAQGQRRNQAKLEKLRVRGG